MSRVPTSTAAVLALTVVLSGRVHLHAQTRPLESKLKAAIVSKFPQFVDWPSTVFATPGRVEVCIASPDPFGVDIIELVADQTLNGRPMVSRVVEREQDLDGCHVLYLTALTALHPHPLLRRALGRPILTISDDPSFLDDGGIVRLRVVNGHVRFDVNPKAAKLSGLRISSQLLQLAGNVGGGP